MAYVVDETENINIVPNAPPISDSLLEFFDKWEGSQYFFGTMCAVQSFKIGTTVTIPDSTFELTRFKFRAWADQPDLIGDIVLQLYENRPLFPLPPPDAQTIVSTPVPSLGQFEGGWLEAIFSPGIQLIKNHDYFMMIQAPDGWWNTSNQNRFLINVCFSSNKYGQGTSCVLWQYNLDTQSIYDYAYRRDIAFQIFGTEVI